MRIINGRVNWSWHYANSPRFVLHLADVPKFEDFRFSVKFGSLWFAEHNGCVRFYSWRGPRNEGGYGGSRFKITLTDGSTKELLGPWSSNAGTMNAAGFEPSVEVSYTEDQGRFPNLSFAGACSAFFLLEAIREGRIDPNFRFPLEEGDRLVLIRIVEEGGKYVTYEPAIRTRGGGLVLKTSSSGVFRQISEVREVKAEKKPQMSDFPDLSGPQTSILR